MADKKFLEQNIQLKDKYNTPFPLSLTLGNDEIKHKIVKVLYTSLNGKKICTKEFLFNDSLENRKEKIKKIIGEKAYTLLEIENYQELGVDRISDFIINCTQNNYFWKDWTINLRDKTITTPNKITFNANFYIVKSNIINGVEKRYRQSMPDDKDLFLGYAKEFIKRIMHAGDKNFFTLGNIKLNQDEINEIKVDIIEENSQMLWIVYNENIEYTKVNKFARKYFYSKHEYEKLLKQIEKEKYQDEFIYIEDDDGNITTDNIEIIDKCSPKTAFGAQ